MFRARYVSGGGARIGVAGGDLDVSESDARVEAGGNETVAQRMRGDVFGHPGALARRRTMRVAA